MEGGDKGGKGFNLGSRAGVVGGSSRFSGERHAAIKPEQGEGHTLVACVLYRRLRQGRAQVFQV
jgi:hypothetical protein